MWRQCLAFSMLALLLAAAPATTQSEDEKPLSLAEAKARAQEETRNEFANLPVITANAMDEILQLSLKENDLILESPLPPTDQSLVRVNDMPGISHVQLDGTADAGGPSTISQYNFENRDFSIPGAVCRYTSASYAGGLITLVQMFETLDDETHSVQLLQNATPSDDESPRVSLYVQITSEPEVKLQMTAKNVIQLRREHPAEVAKYVDPIFTALRQEALLAHVSPKLAWQVFADSFQPTPKLRQKVDALVKQLDADAFPERESASHELEALGQPAAMLLLGVDRKKLSDEQNLRIDTFLARFKPISAADAEKLRRDRDFLIDCLGSDDAQLRQLALDALRRIVRQPVEFDPSAPAEAREAAIARVRETVGTPTTRKYKS